MVCVKGHGTDSLLHKHMKVERLTKTMIVTADGRRFRRDGGDRGRSIPYQPYGGASISTRCQK